MVIKPFSLTRKFLRKHRKWPISPYKTKWQIAFNQNQALQTLKKSASQTPHHHHQQEDHDKPNHLLSALIHSFTSYQCDPTPEAYHFVIKTLTKTSQFHHIPCVLDRIESVEKFQTPEYILAELIRIYGRADRIEDAIDLFCRIPKFRCVPSVYSLNSLLSVLCRSRESIRLVPQMLMKSHVMRIMLEESSFRILISALCRIKKIGYAIQILNCMIDDGYDLDARICSLILSSLCEQKDLALANFEVLDFLEAMKKLGFSPGMMDYSNVIRFLVKEGRGLDALNVLARMKVEGIKPDIVCYTMVLHGIIAEGEYGSADELFDELFVLGLVPDVYTYNVYINGLCKQNNVEAASVSDLSPPRKNRKEVSVPKPTKEERKTGLISGKDIREEIAKSKKEDFKRLQEMDLSMSGRDAEPVYRDKIKGVRITKEEFLKSQRKVEEKPKEKKLEWGKGLAQKREAEARMQELELEKDKPFARSRDDPELDKMLKERVRWGDPMAHLVKPKKYEPVLPNLGDDEKMKDSGFMIPQDIPNHSWLKRGLDAAPNRYGIRPGRHWDGVDRSNGYEKELFKRTNEKQATEQEAYLWSVADM